MTWRTTLMVGLVWLVAACGQTPTSPDTGAGAGAALAEGGESGGSSTTSARKPAPTGTFSFRFVDGLNSQHPNDVSGEPVASEVSGGPIQLTGTVSGAVGSRVFTLAGGPLTLTILNVRRDHAGPGCGPSVEDLLRGPTKQLVGFPLSGTATTLRVDEADGTVDLQVTGIAGADGQTWNLFLFSTSGSHAQITNAGGVITVVQNYGEVGFRVPGRGNKNIESYGACKLYFGLSLTPSP